MKTRNKKERGFAILVVMVLILAMVAAGIAIVGLLDDELQIVGRNRQESEAESAAEAAVLEAIDDEQLGSMLPDFTTPNLSATYRPSGTSPWINSELKISYESDLHFLRVVPLSESSQNWSRALVYEVHAVGEATDDQITSEVSTEVFRPISVPPGTLLPRVHAK